MPWGPEDASAKTKKANTPKRQRQWSHIANGVLAKTGDDKRAIMEANGVLAREAHMPGKTEFSADEERAMRHARRKKRR
jgi:hypothetical protein